MRRSVKVVKKNRFHLFNQSGITLLELVIVAAITGAIAIVLVQFFSKGVMFFQRQSAQSQMASNARTCISTLTRFLQEGKANSTIITSNASATYPPNSRIDFILAADTSTAYAFFYTPPGLVQMQVTRGAVVSTPQTLVDHVTSLMFLGDSVDPSVIYITLRLDNQTPGQNRPDRMQTVLLANQAAHMVSAP